MRQSRCLLLFIAAALSASGCSKKAAPTTAPTADGIISLSPAATDLLVAMGLADRIVGVSPFEANDDLLRRLPKVGDYERIDWERVTELQPKFLIVQGKRDRLPAGVGEKCHTLGIRPVILQIDRLSDIETAVRRISRETGELEAGGRVAAELIQRETTLQDATTKQATTRPAITSLVVLGDDGIHVVGRETFIDDVLALAGGENVLTATGYLSLDSEKLASLRPRAVFLLLPDGNAAADERAKSGLIAAGLSPAAAIFPITDKDVLMPGTAALRLAETMATHLRATP